MYAIGIYGYHGEHVKLPWKQQSLIAYPNECIYVSSCLQSYRPQLVLQREDQIIKLEVKVFIIYLVYMPIVFPIEQHD